MEEQIDLIDIFNLLWKKKIVIIGITIVFMLLAFFKFGVMDSSKYPEEVVEEQKYYAQTVFTIGNFSTITSAGGELPISINQYRDMSDAFVETCAQIAKSQKSLNNVISALSLNMSVEELYNSIIVSRVSDSNSIRIAVGNFDKEQAIKIADELMKEFSKNATDLDIIEDIVVIDNAYIVSGENLVEIVTPVDLPAKPNVAKKVCIIGLVGFVLSVGGVIIVNFLSNTINNENDIDTKLVGIVDDKNQDAFDIIRIKLEQNKAIVITSFESTEKTNSAINNIAKNFEKDNKKVLFVDAEKMASVGENELKNNDYVIVKAKNILEDANSLLAIKQLKNTVLLVTERKTKLDMYKRAKETLEDIDANLLGSILIK